METLTGILKTVGIPPCVKCNKPLTYLNDKNSWRCLDCRPLIEGEDYEFVTSAPICKTQICKKPLSRLESRGSWRCFHCTPWPKGAPAPKQEKKFLDVAMTEKRVREIIAKKETMSEERIREIVQDELMNWHIQKPSVTKSDISEMTATEVEAAKEMLSRPVFDEKNSGIVITEIDGVPWREKAKELGINSFGRKKADVLAEIKAKQTV